VNTPVETYLDTFCQSLPSDTVSRADQPNAMTVTDMDSGDLHPLDSHVWDPSSSEDSGCDWSSDDCDLFKDMPPPDWNEWLDELMEDLSSDDVSSLYDLLKDMSPDDWVQEMSFDMDDFVCLAPFGGHRFCHVVVHNWNGCSI